ncbi:hypothetical protein MRX96_054464 [Rhipicephalus microplus]
MTLRGVNGRYVTHRTRRRSRIIVGNRARFYITRQQGDGSRAVEAPAHAGRSKRKAALLANGGSPTERLRWAPKHFQLGAPLNVCAHLFLLRPSHVHLISALDHDISRSHLNESARIAER